MIEQAHVGAPSREIPLIAAARGGNQDAFRRLTDPHRRELRVHCYRMLGSLHDAEDLVQETLLRAWRRLDTFEGRASFRAWLYKIATNACLDALDRRRRPVLPAAYGPAADPNEPISPPVAESVWIEPYPDALLDGEATDPEARYDAQESVALAFLAAIQHLPARQRAVLILRDVLGWSASEVAELLESTVASVNSALQRARATLKERFPAGRSDSAVGPAADEPERSLLDRYVRAWERADVDALVALLKEDAILAMPPYAEWYRGRASIAAFLSSTVFAGEVRGRQQLLPTRANGQPAFAVYESDAEDGVYRARAIKLLTLEGGKIAEITASIDPSLFRFFSLPDTLQT